MLILNCNNTIVFFCVCQSQRASTPTYYFEGKKKKNMQFFILFMKKKNLCARSGINYYKKINYLQLSAIVQNCSQIIT